MIAMVGKRTEGIRSAATKDSAAANGSVTPMSLSRHTQEERIYIFGSALFSSIRSCMLPQSSWSSASC